MECNNETMMCEVLECGTLGQCPEGSICDPDQNLCTLCGKCMDCAASEYCAPGYICMPKPETNVCEDNGWECGDDGEGGSCGQCPDGKECNDSHTCYTVSNPEQVEDIGGGEQDTGNTPQEETTVQPEEDTGGGGEVECPPGYHKWFGKCVPDEPEEEPKDDGCACNLYGGGRSLGNGVLLVFLFTVVLFFGVRRRSRGMTA